MEDVSGRRRWTSFLRLFAAAGALALAAGLLVTIAIDPFWVFRRHPPWLAWTGGVNRFLDLEMRRAKPLQLFTRPAATVVVGSSTVYHGLHPRDLAKGDGYNFGLASLMVDELPTVAALLAERGTARVVIGLDFFMFTDFPGPPPLKTGLERYGLRAAHGFGRL
jgi:hypothetical protein